jgi:hypothetical protein
MPKGALLQRIAAALSALVLLAAAPPALAETDRVARMSEQLRQNEDFRVRTQAALALGASKDRRAVEPLCAGLDDSNTTVRAAAAAALGKLSLGGLDCLTAHQPKEENSSVASVIDKAIDRIRAGTRPVISADTRDYVAIGDLTDKTGRSGSALNEHVRSAIERASNKLDGCLVAPAAETPADAKATLKKWKALKAFFLWPKALPPEYGGGKLTIKFEISVFTYPGKALKGTIPLKLTLPDVGSVDIASEDDLFGRAAESAFERFAANVGRFE